MVSFSVTDDSTSNDNELNSDDIYDAVNTLEDSPTYRGVLEDILPQLGIENIDVEITDDLVQDGSGNFVAGTGEREPSDPTQLRVVISVEELRDTLRRDPNGPIYGPDGHRYSRKTLEEILAEEILAAAHDAENDADNHTPTWSEIIEQENADNKAYSEIAKELDPTRGDAGPQYPRTDIPGGDQGNEATNRRIWDINNNGDDDWYEKGFSDRDRNGLDDRREAYVADALGDNDRVQEILELYGKGDDQSVARSAEPATPVGGPADEEAMKALINSGLPAPSPTPTAGTKPPPTEDPVPSTPIDDGNAWQQLLFGFLMSGYNLFEALLTLGSTTADPLVVDLDDDGIELTSLDTSMIFFDLDADGFRERTGWVSSDDGFLAIDADDNGEISDVSELFGDDTTDGFTALSSLDSNSDGVIDSSDTQFSDLLIWQDLNGDGRSQEDELGSLGDHNIVSIDVDGATSVSETIAGNNIDYESTVTFSDMSTSDIVNVNFNLDQMATIQQYPTYLTTQVLSNLYGSGYANLRGYGEVPDLFNKIAEDSEFYSAFDALMSDNLSDPEGYISSLEEVLFRWAGVYDNSPTSRGSYIDSRKVDTMLAFLGRDLDGSHGEEIWEPQAPIIQDSWRAFLNTFMPRFLAFGTFASAFSDVEYNILSNLFTGSIDVDSAITALDSGAPTSVIDNRQYWAMAITTIDAIGLDLGHDVYGAEFTHDIAHSLYDNGVEWVPEDLRNFAYLTGTSSADTITGDSDDNFVSVPEPVIPSNIIRGEAGNDSINDDDGGNDVLDGGSGNDTLTAGEGDDILIGGSGDDTMTGGIGDDLFIVGDGDDEINVSTSGTDTVWITGGHDFNDLTFARLNDDDLEITIPGGNSVILRDQLGASASRIEYLQFDDGSTYFLPDLETTWQGSASADTMNGITGGGSSPNETVYGNGGNDIIDLDDGANEIHGGDGADNITVDGPEGNLIYGDGGNDTITSGDGHDEIHGGAGADTINDYSGGDDEIYGDAGDDTIDAGEGNDTIDGGADDDTIKGDEGTNWLEGGTGDDRIEVNGTLDAWYDTNWVTDTSGTDTLRVNQSSGNTLLEQIGDDLYIIDQLYEDVTVVVDQFAGGSVVIETLEYSDTSTLDLTTYTPADNGDDLTGDSGANTLSGGNYSDTIDGLGGNDTLNGNEGNDLLQGGAGDDTLNGGKHRDWLEGGAGDDNLYGGEGDDIYRPGTGDDTIRDYRRSNYDVIEFESGVDFEDLSFDRVSITSKDIVITNDVTGDTITIEDQVSYSNDELAIELLRFSDATEMLMTDISIETVGTASNNTINDITGGMSLSNTLKGEGGNDVINAKDGDDTVYGGTGNDYIGGDSGDDTLYGEAGDDTIDGDAGDDVLDGGADDDLLRGGSGDDTYYAGTGADTVRDQGASTDIRDVIILPSGVVESDLTFSRVNDYDLQIDISGGGSITVEEQFNSSLYTVEFLEFDDGSRLSLTNLYVENNGTSGADTLKGAGVNATEHDILRGAAGNDTIYGYNGNDLLEGEAGNDSVWGGNGNDTLTGGAGTDTLRGENGDDYIDGGTGDDTIYGDDDDDTYFYESGDGDDTIYDDDGEEDRIIFGANLSVADLVFNQSGNDLIISTDSSGNNDITIDNHYLSADDEIEVLEFDDSTTFALSDLAGGGLEIIGTNGDDDSLSGSSSAETIYGRYGDDVLSGGAGNDTLNGGVGSDTADYSGETAAITANLSTGSATGAGTDTLTSIENLVGGSGADSLTGDASDNSFTGGAGNDTINGGAGTDTIDFSDATAAIDVDLSSGTATGDGSDTLSNLENIITGSGADTLEGNAGDNRLEGGAGNDTYVYGSSVGNDTIFDAGGTADVLEIGSSLTVDDLVFRWDGGDLNVEVDGTGTVYATIERQSEDDHVIESIDFTYDSSTFDLTTLQGFGIEYYGSSSGDTLNGTSEDEFIHGEDGADTINAGGGADILFGGSGNDALNGDAGDDTLRSDAGDDALDGGAGTDTADYSGETAAITASLLSGTASGAGSDTFSNIENLIGGSGADSLTGDTGNNVITGNAGNDTIDGGSGTDTVDYSDETTAITVDLSSGSATGAGTDTISNIEDVVTGSGDDTLTGSSGNNTLEGGAGDDTYVYGTGVGNDTIIETGGDDVLQIGSSLTLDDITFTRDGDDLRVEVDGTGNVYMTIDNHFADQSAIVETIEFTTDSSTFDLRLINSSVVEFFGTSSGETLNGGTDNEFIHGLDGADTINAGSGEDVLFGDGGNDTLNGDGDNDTIMGDAGDDTINGGAGTDTVDYSAISSAVTVDLSNASAQNTGGAGTDTISNVENVTGGAGDDTLTGTSSTNVLTGGAGDDTLSGGAGDDIFAFGRYYGADTINRDDTSSTGDEVHFGEYIDPYQLWFEQSGNSLVATVIGTNDSITVNDWFNYGDDPIDQFETDGGATLDASDVASLVSAMASFDPPAQGTFDLPANLADELNDDIAAAWTIPA